MAEFISRLFLLLVIVFVTVPLACLFSTPYVLLRPIYLKVEKRRFWREVRLGYARVIRACFEWGGTPF